MRRHAPLLEWLISSMMAQHRSCCALFSALPHFLSFFSHPFFTLPHRCVDGMIDECSLFSCLLRKARLLTPPCKGAQHSPMLNKLMYNFFFAKICNVWTLGGLDLNRWNFINQIRVTTWYCLYFKVTCVHLSSSDFDVASNMVDCIGFFMICAQPQKGGSREKYWCHLSINNNHML